MSRLSLILALWLSTVASVSQAQLFEQGAVDSLDGHPALQTVVTQLAAQSRVRGEFRQVKTVKLLKRPLVSEGSMLFDRDYGLWWHIRTPFESTLVVTGEQLVQRSGSTESSLAIDSNPLALAFAHTFFQVLSGDIASLTEDFELFFQQRPPQWQIGLVPRDTQMRGVIQSIVLSGDEELQHIEIRDHVGDSTRIEFIQRLPEGPALTDKERAQFVF